MTKQTRRAAPPELDDQIMRVVNAEVRDAIARIDDLVPGFRTLARQHQEDIDQTSNVISLHILRNHPADLDNPTALRDHARRLVKGGLGRRLLPGAFRKSYLFAALAPTDLQLTEVAFWVCRACDAAGMAPGAVTTDRPWAIRRANAIVARAFGTLFDSVKATVETIRDTVPDGVAVLKYLANPATKSKPARQAWAAATLTHPRLMDDAERLRDRLRPAPLGEARDRALARQLLDAFFVGSQGTAYAPHVRACLAPLPPTVSEALLTRLVAATAAAGDETSEERAALTAIRHHPAHPIAVWLADVDVSAPRASLDSAAALTMVAPALLNLIDQVGVLATEYALGGIALEARAARGTPAAASPADPRPAALATVATLRPAAAALLRAYPRAASVARQLLRACRDAPSSIFSGSRCPICATTVRDTTYCFERRHWFVLPSSNTHQSRDVRMCRYCCCLNRWRAATCRVCSHPRLSQGISRIFFPVAQASPGRASDDGEAEMETIEVADPRQPDPSSLGIAGQMTLKECFAAAHRLTERPAQECVKGVELFEYACLEAQRLQRLAPPGPRANQLRGAGYVDASADDDLEADRYRALRRLSQLLEHSANAVKMGAAQALGAIGDPAPVEELIGRLDDGTPIVRAVVAQALIDIGGRRALGAVWAMLKTAAMPSDLRAALTQALAARVARLAQRREP